jgi:putative ubiquitin-RnfH superfamily antitoxin RatB of RatAB toxin-antitoxin module
MYARQFGLTPVARLVEVQTKLNKVGIYTTTVKIDKNGKETETVKAHPLLAQEKTLCT